MREVHAHSDTLILGSFSYADITTAVVLETVDPIARANRL